MCINRAVGEQGSGACHHCHAALETRGAVGRRDACPSCGVDVRCCRNCAHYEAGYHNDCRETQAERQVDKERGNFCDFFRLAAARPAPVARPGSSARGDLEALFGKAGNRKTE
jgi:hypothetical protein